MFIKEKDSRYPCTAAPQHAVMNSHCELIQPLYFVHTRAAERILGPGWTVTAFAQLEEANIS